MRTRHGSEDAGDLFHRRSTVDLEQSDETAAAPATSPVREERGAPGSVDVIRTQRDGGTAS